MKGLLTTKLYIQPPRPNAIARPRLSEKLLTGLSQPGSFGLLSGPAGFGKTTLLSEFVTQLHSPVAWVSLDEGDNDPVLFWSYVIAACQVLNTEFGASAQPLLGSPQPLPIETIPTILINDLAGLGRKLVLILDDFHTIQNDSIQAAFAFLLEHLPGNLYPIIATRADPSWPLARFRARSRLVEIRARDLRFTPDETALFLQQTAGLDLTVEEIADLEARTEGWIAGLQLAVIALQSLVSEQGSRDISGFVRAFSGSHIYVAEYLLEEVLQRQPQGIQDFLLQTSILEFMNAGLCETITARRDGQDMLFSLKRSNLFVTPLDNQGQWFRYHRLFAELLQVRLRHTRPVGEIADLHRVAAGWYEQHEYTMEAVNHYLAAQDFDQAARLIGDHADDILTRGELATLMRWTDALPDEVVWLHPAIMIAKIWSLSLVGAVRQVEPLLREVESRFELDCTAPAWRELAGFAAAIRAFFAMMVGEDTRALELARRAEALLPDRSVHARWLLPYTLGAAYRGQGQYEMAAEAFARQARMGEENDHLVVWGTGITAIALVLFAQGRLQETSELCRQALHRLAEMGATRYGSLAKLETPLVEVLIEQNELEEAEQRLTDVLARMQAWPMPTDRLHAQLALIELQEAKGDLPGAGEALRIAKDLKATQPVLKNLARSVELYEVRLTLANGDLATADRLMDALRPGASHWVELSDQELLLLGRLHLAQGRWDEAERILSPLASQAETHARKRTMIISRALQACVYQKKGKRDAALAFLTQALAIAEREGFVRAFVSQGDEMRELLAAVARWLETVAPEVSLPSRAYVARLLNAFPKEPVPGADIHAPEQVPGLIEPLSRRELEVLQLISAGDSNRMIADKLVITVSAVKKHAANIYGKLNVSRRTEAVARARQLGLLVNDE